jgi:hypothetical protein
MAFIPGSANHAFPVTLLISPSNPFFLQMKEALLTLVEGLQTLNPYFKINSWN